MDGGRTGQPPEGAAPEVSVVMPCLNEADTIEMCVRKAVKALREDGISGEVIVADNGSGDGSPGIAVRAGARVVNVADRGYGSALSGGIAAARGAYVIMGDADDSYDFGEIPRFVKKLREGFDLVQGCRLPAGGGQVEDGAMPFLHRWVGNPLFSHLARRWFGAPIHDAYCGMRGFRKAFVEGLGQRCTGMEFATEMIVKAGLRKAKFAEVGITLHKDGRKSHTPHLKTFRDGWRTLRFYLMLSPRWLFLYPALALILAGLGGYAIAMPGLRIHGILFDAHTLLVSSLALICGFQALVFGVSTKFFAIGEGLLPRDEHLEHALRVVNLERGIIAGALACVGGLSLIGVAVAQWWNVGFGNLVYAKTMRLVVPGVTLTALGFQAVLSSFFLSILGLRRR